MRLGQRLKVMSIAVLMLIVAAACQGTSSDEAVETSPVVDASVPIATTEPILLETSPVESGDESNEELLEVGAESANDAAIALAESQENEWLVDVLHVNDDASIIPTFDGPFGEEAKLLDINEVDGVTTEYSLLAETANGNRLALLVEEFDSTGAWAKVQVPVRPNGSTTWVQTAFFTQESHDYHITIDVSEALVSVYKGEQLLMDQVAVLGRETRPTPLVRTYLDEKIPGASVSPAFGDWILSVAAHSEVLGTFNGNMPKTAIHGTDQPELMGQYVSSGCIRVPNEIISFIAEAVPLGAIVDIVA